MSDDLESRMIKDLKSGDCSIERALLVVSGLKNEKQIRKYEKKLDMMNQDFKKWCVTDCDELVEKLDDFDKAEALFDYLWETKIERYNDDNSLLADIIDRQLVEDNNQTVGNCFGLTSLYTVLGLRNGLNLSVLHEPDHILSSLDIDGKKIPIENTDPYGFGIADSEDDKYEERDLIYLVSEAFHNRGRTKAELNDFDGSISDFDKAIELKPDLAEAFYDRGRTKAELNDFGGAISDFDKASELKPDYADPFYNRGHAKFKLKDFEGSISDYDKFIELKPDYADAFYNRGLAKYNLGDFGGALSDFDKVIELKPDAKAFYYRSKTKMELGDYEEAMYDLLKLDEIDPKFKEPEEK